MAGAPRGRPSGTPTVAGRPRSWRRWPMPACCSIAVGAIAVEAVRRIMAAGRGGRLDGGLGVAAPASSDQRRRRAAVHASGREGDLNIRGAYLHMAADAGVSARRRDRGAGDHANRVGVDRSGRQSGHSRGASSRQPRAAAATRRSWRCDARAAGASTLRGGAGAVCWPTRRRRARCHDLHVWSMSTNETALTAHLVQPGGHRRSHSCTMSAQSSRTASTSITPRCRSRRAAMSASWRRRKWCRPASSGGPSISEHNQRHRDEAAGKQQPVLGYVEKNGGAAADQRPDKGNDEKPARQRRGRRSSSSPKVKIVTGHGVTPNTGIAGIKVARRHADQGIDDRGIGDECHTEPGLSDRNGGQIGSDGNTRRRRSDNRPGSTNNAANRYAALLIARRTARDRRCRSRATSPPGCRRSRDPLPAGLQNNRATARPPSWYAPIWIGQIA